jgi:hypothetical protein
MGGIEDGVLFLERYLMILRWTVFAFHVPFLDFSDPSSSTINTAPPVPAGTEPAVPVIVSWCFARATSTDGTSIQQRLYNPN